MEPTIAISALAKLIGLGMKGWSAIESRGFEEKDIAAIQALLETGTSFASLRKADASTVAAQHLALVARSFGQAVGRHQEFHGKLLLTGGVRRWLNRSDREREEEIELRVKVAALQPHGLGDDPRGEVERRGTAASSGHRASCGAGSASRRGENIMAAMAGMEATAVAGLAARDARSSRIGHRGSRAEATGAHYETHRRRARHGQREHPRRCRAA